MKTLIPDYSKIDTIFIVSPIGLRDEIKEEIFQFIKILIKIAEDKDDKKIVVVCESEKALEKTQECLPSTEIISFVVCDVYDIWIRDYFISANYKEGKELGGVKAIYSPSYNPYSSLDDAAGSILARKYFENVFNIPIKLDGGNVILNKDYILCSEKIYTENYKIGKESIDDYFNKNFSQKLVTLPTETLDVIGHTDGILRFFDDSTILLPIYDSDYQTDNKYIMTVKKILMEKLGLNYSYIFIPSFLDDTINENNIFSARGIYINYFRFEDHIIFPSFSESKWYEMEIQKIFSKLNIFVHFVPLDNTALAGGCLNCITNVKYK